MRIEIQIQKGAMTKLKPWIAIVMFGWLLMAAVAAMQSCSKVAVCYTKQPRQFDRLIFYGEPDFENAKNNRLEGRVCQ